MMTAKEAQIEFDKAKATYQEKIIGDDKLFRRAILIRLDLIIRMLGGVK